MEILKNFKNRTLSLVAMLSVLVMSCDLEIEESDSLITEGGSAVFNGVEDVDGSISNIYNNITGQAGDQANLYAMTEVTTDELLVPTRGTDWGDNGIWRTLHAHTWSPTHNYVVGVWNNKNSAVLRATEVLDPLSGANAEQSAHAHFTRAYNMWIVLDFYGQVPFRNPTDGPDIVPSVMTRAEAYDMVVSDLEAAISGLPEGSPTSDNKTRGTKAAARLLLAKVKLNAEVYLGSYGASDLQDVIDLVNDIEAAGYALTGQGTYFDVFPGPNVANTDVIWSVDAGAGNRMWNGLHYNQSHPDNGGGGWNGFTTLAEFYDKFDGPTDDNSLGAGQEERRGYTHTAASTTEANQGFGFGFQLGQMYGFRDGAAVALTDRGGAPLAFTKEMPGLIGNNEVTGMRLLKYSPVNGGFTNGVVMARYADALLMKAEAKLRSGDAAGALADVNALRAMRSNTAPLTSLDLDEMIDERARELYTEGWRRNDLIRFGKFTDGWEFKEAGDGTSVLFPIPSAALLSNPNLVQNDGY